MKVSAISLSEDCKPRRNSFISYMNSFMSATNVESPIEKANQINSKKQPKMGIENLEEFTIFPKQIIDGKTIITA
jgi:hypothetical protein